jgi:hypothetical protein
MYDIIDDHVWWGGNGKESDVLHIICTQQLLCGRFDVLHLLLAANPAPWTSLTKSSVHISRTHLLQITMHYYKIVVIENSFVSLLLKGTIYVTRSFAICTVDQYYQDNQFQENEIWGWDVWKNFPFFMKCVSSLSCS